MSLFGVVLVTDSALELDFEGTELATDDLSSLGVSVLLLCPSDGNEEAAEDDR